MQPIRVNRKIELTLCVVVLFAVGTTAAPGQTPCPVAELLGPAPGSTLPAGAVTFEWCNANADYFLTVETIPGAHDIFFAFAGGPGPNAGVISVTLGPDCAPTIPTGCVPARGETIFVILWTLRRGVVVPPSPFRYTFTAANNVRPTTTTVGEARVFARARPQVVTLTARVGADSTVTEGTVRFTVLDGATIVGTPVTSAVLTSGSASVDYTLPAGMTPGTHTIRADYSGSPSLQASSSNGILTVNPAPPERSRTPGTVPWRIN